MEKEHKQTEKEKTQIEKIIDIVLLCSIMAVSGACVYSFTTKKTIENIRKMAEKENARAFEQGYALASLKQTTVLTEACKNINNSDFEKTLLTEITKVNNEKGAIIEKKIANTLFSLED